MIFNYSRITKGLTKKQTNSPKNSVIISAIVVSKLYKEL